MMFFSVNGFYFNFKAMPVLSLFCLFAAALHGYAFGAEESLEAKKCPGKGNRFFLIFAFSISVANRPEALCLGLQAHCEMGNEM